MRCAILLILVLFQVAYLIGGGYIFWALESPGEKQLQQQQREFNLTHIIGNLTASNSCLSDDELQHFANRVLDAERSGLVTSKQSNNWDIHGSMFFAMTVVTTIGYGNVAPKSNGGQIFCCFFAIVGIPLTMVMLLRVGELLKTLSKKMKCKICCRHRPRLNKLINTTVIVTVGFAFFLILPAGIFTLLEGWDYGTSVYYGITTTTTVGFGDYVAAWDCYGSTCWVYRISVGIWTYLGLAWLAGVITSIQEFLESLITKADPKQSSWSPETPPEQEKKPTANLGSEKEVTEGGDTQTPETIICRLD